MEKAVSWKKILILAIAVCLFAGIIVKCNQFQKTPLASYKGQKYEKAVVTKIIKDNLAEDGSRYGTQKVLVKMITGTYKGKEKQAINPSGTLFGADCKVGAGITGYNVSDIEALNYVGQNTKIKIGELLFAGIIISALGAVMDVGMSIASTIQEIYETDKTLSMKRLFVSGINVGRDMMGTMTNTLIFAYVGGAMTTLVINYAYDLSYRQLANSYVIGIEIMQGLSGSLGVVLTVPITALIASFLAVRKK